MPLAHRLTIKLSPISQQDFVAFVTAVDSEAPNLLKWNNPVNWYRYHGGTPVRRWFNEVRDEFEVEAIIDFPNRWPPSPMPQLSGDILFVLRGCADRDGPDSIALFPETLRKDLREVRATLEAYSKTKKLDSVDAAVQRASGLGYAPLISKPLQIVYHNESGSSQFLIDRWE